MLILALPVLAMSAGFALLEIAAIYGAFRLVEWLTANHPFK
jgi:hypothetical protein